MKDNEFITKFELKGIHIGDRRKNCFQYVKYGSKFTLTREPDNKFDQNAILVELQVRTNRKLDLGYIPKDLAAEIAPKIDAGEQYSVTFRIKIISEKTGKLIKIYLNLNRIL